VVIKILVTISVSNHRPFCVSEKHAGGWICRSEASSSSGIELHIAQYIPAGTLRCQGSNHGEQTGCPVDWIKGMLQQISACDRAVFCAKI
jgi:hypothetical protein